MQLSASSKHNESYGYKAWMYNYVNESISVAGSVMTGRYPNSGWAVNQEADHVLLIFSGTVLVQTRAGSVVELHAGDAYHIPKLEYYAVTPISSEPIKVWIISSPPFQISQHDIVGDDPGELEAKTNYVP